MRTRRKATYLVAVAVAIGSFATAETVVSHPGKNSHTLTRDIIAGSATTSVVPDSTYWDP